MRNKLNIPAILGFSVAGVMFIAGTGVLTGLVIPESFPTRFRVIFGIVLLLFSIYRALLTYMNYVKRSRNDE